MNTERNRIAIEHEFLALLAKARAAGIQLEYRDGDNLDTLTPENAPVNIDHDLTPTLDLRYPVGLQRTLLTRQLDDDDGEERWTEPGSMVEIINYYPENTDNPYSMGCPANGASWFFSEAQLEAETTDFVSQVA